MKHPTDGTIICDMCLCKAERYPSEVWGQWYKRGERDICPQCAYLVNRALSAGVVSGEALGVDEVVLEGE